MDDHGENEFGLLMYVAGVVGLGGLVIGLLAQLYLRRIPAFSDAVVTNPVAAVRNDPVAVALIAGTGLATVLLVALIVGFGARYGLPADERRRE